MLLAKNVRCIYPLYDHFVNWMNYQDYLEESKAHLGRFGKLIPKSCREHLCALTPLHSKT